jgi:hypothetical protein
MLELVNVNRATDQVHKYIAVFQTDHGLKHVSFGAHGYEDYTQHKDPKRMELYLSRHRGREDWTNPLTPGALSRWLLWNKPTLRESIADFKKRFSL